MKSAEIREAFLRFFEEKGHTRVASSSLIPANDPTLLFANAGMNQFKDCFLGLEKRAYTRATTSQKCVRAGGKHNDLENVGYTARHHTFFEMLGNFSFGDYFKRDAIHYAWEFLTSPKWLGLPKEKLMVTVYASDDEAFDIWNKEVGVPAEKIVRIGDNKGAPYASDNFWSMGDTGPCGPCTEIFFDHGDHIWGGPPGSPEEDGDRFIEIWNNVFMQFNRTADGVLHPLPAPSVDTGMGLERISAVMQKVHANYEIDLFQKLLAASAAAIGCANDDAPSLKVVADHIRSCGFLIADGVVPSNEGRGYVLRRIIRRACRHGNKLGARGTFFHKIYAALVAEMGETYPELKTQQAHVERILRTEEEQFAKTLEQGLILLDRQFNEMTSDTIPGEVVFKLYDTFGFPVDLTADIARERNISIDYDGFNREMQMQRVRSRNTSTFSVDYSCVSLNNVETVFTGYTATTDQGHVSHLIKDGKLVPHLCEGDEGAIILDRTPFYAESGGQVGDRGVVSSDGLHFTVTNTTRHGNAIMHCGKVEFGFIKVGQAICANVDSEVRHATALNHTATHLLHSALREVLGCDVHQKGSLINHEGLRFDFNHSSPVCPEQLRRIEMLVNLEIWRNTQVDTKITSISDAMAMGATVTSANKYSTPVRVLTLGDGFSIELCGGTHASRTGDLGLFKIVKEFSVSTGVRRIEAITATRAFEQLTATEDLISEAASLVGCKRSAFMGKLSTLIDRNAGLECDVARLKTKIASITSETLSSVAKDRNGIKFLFTRVDGLDSKTMTTIVDQLKGKLYSAVILIGGVDGDKVNLVAGVTRNSIGQYNATVIIKQVAALVGGNGGGRAELAIGGGNDSSQLNYAIEMAEKTALGRA